MLKWTLALERELPTEKKSVVNFENDKETIIYFSKY